MVIEEVADVLRMLCCKGREVHLRRICEVDALIADVASSKTGKLRQQHDLVDGVLPCGSTLLVVHGPSSDTTSSQRPNVVTALKSAKKSLPARITLLEDPDGTECKIPLSVFGSTVVFQKNPAMQTANDHLEKPFSAEDVLDLLLVDLGMVKWCEMLSRWNSAGKGWTTKKKVLGATHWYMAGQRLGRQPIYDSVCAFCGSLLYGALNSPELGNKFSGKPVTIDEKVVRPTSSSISALQPPFLLRWSPAYLAEKLPDVFAWDMQKKRLTLREEHRQRPPWTRKAHNRDKNQDEHWLYRWGVPKNKNSMRLLVTCEEGRGGGGGEEKGGGGQPP